MLNKNKFKLFVKNLQLIDLFFFVIVIVGFQICYGLKIIYPTNINWIMSVHHDWGQHYLGWAFYRNEAWTFPLGTIKSYNYPVGTNIGFMDSIPILALILKPFSTVLPQNFQYLGFWLFTCMFFLAIYTRKILQLYKISNWIIALAILIMIANPVFLFRAIHPALSSHFLILGSIYNYLRPSFSISKKINKHQVFLFVIASTVNPYIMVMVFGFNLIVPFKHYIFDKTINFKQCIFYPMISLLVFVLFWILIGMIEFKNGTNVASSELFSEYSFNLNSFFDSYGYYSKFIPDLGRVNPLQYEGFAYFGIGMIILFFASFTYTIYLLWKKRISLYSIKKWGFLLILCLVLLTFAITNVVSLNNQIITIIPLPKIIEKLGFIFRASGRFVWPLYYLIFICSIIIFNKIKINSYIKHFIFLFITILQLYDTQELFLRWKLPEGDYKTPLQDKSWIKVMKNFEDVIIYPSFDYNYSINYTNDYQDLSFLALKAKKPISNGYVARANINKAQEFTTNLLIDLNSGFIEPRRLFITTNKHLNDFKVLLNKEIVDIHKMNDFVFIYKKNINLKSSDFKEDYSTKIFIDSVKSHFKNLKLAELEPVEYRLNATKPIKYFFDKFNFQDNIVKIRGWAILEESNNNQNETIFLLFKKNNLKFEIKLNSEERLDITTYFKKENLNNAGFNSVIFTKKLNKGAYTVGLVIKKTNGENIYIDSGRKIIIN